MREEHSHPHNAGSEAEGRNESFNSLSSHVRRATSAPVCVGGRPGMSRLVLEATLGQAIATECDVAHNDQVDSLR